MSAATKTRRAPGWGRLRVVDQWPLVVLQLRDRIALVFTKHRIACSPRGRRSLPVAYAAAFSGFTHPASTVHDTTRRLIASAGTVAPSVARSTLQWPCPYGQ